MKNIQTTNTNTDTDTDTSTELIINSNHSDESIYTDKTNYLDQKYYSYRQHGIIKTTLIHPHVRSIGKLIEQKQSQGYILYAVTITYPDWKTHTPTAIDINNYFRQIYWDNLLPDHIFEDNDWQKGNQKKASQPIVYAFIDEHQSKVTRVISRKKSNNLEFSTALHHHAIFAVHPNYQDKMDQLIGENTLKPFHKRFVMSSCVKRCDVNWVLYAGKLYSRNNEEFPVFGPRSEVIRPSNAK